MRDVRSGEEEYTLPLPSKSFGRQLFTDVARQSIYVLTDDYAINDTSLEPITGTLFRCFPFKELKTISKNSSLRSSTISPLTEQFFLVHSEKRGLSTMDFATEEFSSFGEDKATLESASLAKTDSIF